MLFRALASLVVLTELVSGAALRVRDTASTDSVDAAAAKKGSWTSIAPIPVQPRQEHGSVAFDSNTIYIMGGIYPLDGFPTVTTVQKYTISTNQWSTVASLPMPLNHPNPAVVNGKIYVMGGLTTTSNPLFWNATGACFMYDPASNKWTTIAQLPRGREIGSAAVGVVGNTIYLAGGLSNTSLTPDDAEGTVGVFTSYNTKTQKFTTLPDMPAGRDHAGTGLINNNLYVLGGRYGGHNNTKDTAYKYDIQNGCWDSMAKLPTATGGCASGILGTQIFIFGGEGYQKTPDGLFPGVQAYDVSRNSWTTNYKNMDVPRHGSYAATVGGKIYIPGGGTHMGGQPTNYSSYFSL